MKNFFGCAMCLTLITGALSENITFKDVITLKNKYLTVSVSPQAGRITGFSLKGGRNILKINSEKNFTAEYKKTGYRNHGGDKVLNSQHHDWFFNMRRPCWPPDEYVDGKPWLLIEKSHEKIVIKSEISKYLGTRMTRIIELPANAQTLSITNIMEQVKPTVFPVMIWTISLVEKPDFALLDTRKKYFDDTLWNDLRIDSCQGAVSKINRSTIKFAPVSLEPKPKIGTLGQWLAAVYKDLIFIQQSPLNLKKCYGDGASLEIFAAANIYELETLSPQVHLQPGESIRHKVIWKLIKRPDMQNKKLISYIIERAGK